MRYVRHATPDFLTYILSLTQKTAPDSILPTAEDLRYDTSFEIPMIGLIYALFSDVKKKVKKKD